MNSFLSSAVIAIVLISYVTDSEAFSFLPVKKFKFPNIDILVKLPDMKDFKAPKIPSKFFHPPQTTTPPTTTPPTTTPPTTTPPPPPTTIHPDDVTIALCTESMAECPWTVEVLAQKIVERRQVDKKATFNGKGKSVGPKVNPGSVEDKSVGVIEPTIGSIGPGSSAKMEKPKRPGVPKQCYPFGEKHRSNRKYKINCISYLYDTTIAHYPQRRQYMIGCFTCRNLCEIGGAIRFL